MEPTAKITYKNGKPEFIVINGSRLSRFDILAMASNSDDKEFAWELIKIASQLFHWQGDATFNSLYDSVVTKLVVDHENNEFKLHQKFNEQVKRLISNEADVVKRINNVHHQPDSWVRIGDELIPVEIKKNNFNKKALSQLQRYMNFYGCSKGIAVGYKKSVKIPENILFIPTERLL